MKNLLLFLICVLGIVMVPCSQAASKPAKAVKPCVSQIHVIKGCPACEAMQNWLKKAGFKLSVTNIEQGHYKLYPTVIYSDKTADHGERLYRQEVGVPETICVLSCSFGTE